jgi:hypothetical protein
MPKRLPGRRRGDQRRATFLRNHARSISACDFVTAVTATSRLLDVFVLIHHGSRRPVHWDVIAHPTAAWHGIHARHARRISAFGAGGERALARLPRTPASSSTDDAQKTRGLRFGPRPI